MLMQTLHDTWAPSVRSASATEFSRNSNNADVGMPASIPPSAPIASCPPIPKHCVARAGEPDGCAPMIDDCVMPMGERAILSGRQNEVRTDVVTVASCPQPVFDHGHLIRMEAGRVCRAASDSDNSAEDDPVLVRCFELRATPTGRKNLRAERCHDGAPWGNGWIRRAQRRIPNGTGHGTDSLPPLVRAVYARDQRRRCRLARDGGGGHVRSAGMQAPPFSVSRARQLPREGPTETPRYRNAHRRLGPEFDRHSRPFPSREVRREHPMFGDAQGQTRRY